MDKMKKILKISFQIGFVCVFLLTASISAAAGYILFAPDDFPKPFYLSYQGGGAYNENSGVSGPASYEEPTNEHSIPAIAMEVDPGEGIMIPSGAKVINLFDPSGRRYIRVNLVFEFAPTDPEYYVLLSEDAHSAVADEEDGHSAEGTESPLDVYIDAYKAELNELTPIINDGLITLISSKSFEEVKSPGGKETLRLEIIELLNIRLPSHKIISIYFTEFVVQ